MQYIEFEVIFLEKTGAKNKALLERYYHYAQLYNLSKPQLVEVLNFILDTNKHFPTPNEFSAVVRERFASYVVKPKNIHCDFCHGDGDFYAVDKEDGRTVFFQCPNKCDPKSDLIPTWNKSYEKYYIPQFVLYKP